MYDQLVFDKAGKSIQWKKTQSLHQMVLGNLDGNMQKMKLDHFLTSYTKINSKWMKALNVRQETIKILEKKTDRNLFDLSCSNCSLDISPETRKIKTKKNFWGVTKIKSFCTVKEKSQQN